MKQHPLNMKLRVFIPLVLLVSMLSLSAASSSKVSPAAPAERSAIVLEPQECSKCEGKCKAWIDKCKEGGQYACYKAAACLCKCNLDAGGCGSSKEALQECYEQNEKLAKDLGPSEPQSDVR